MKEIEINDWLRQADEEFWEWIKKDRIYQLYFYTLIKWKRVELVGKRISDHFDGMSIAVYGAGMVGELLCKELVRDGADVRYALDRSGVGTVQCGDVELDVFSVNNAREVVDCILVSATPYIDDIEKDLNNLSFNPVLLTIDDVCEMLLEDSE